MTIFEALIFGIVQGITEFLPISSTAHIIIVELIFGYNFPGLTFEIYLHLASALAVIFYFRRDLWILVCGFFRYVNKRSAKDRLQFLFCTYIIVATIITGIIGLILLNTVEEVMKTPRFIAAALMVTGSALIVLERFKGYGNRKQEQMNFLDAVIVGLSQALAVLPGISRSGSTLVTALWLGLERDTAVRYSFLLVIPIILGSGVLLIGDASAVAQEAIGTIPLIISFLSSFAFSLVGIIWLINFLKRGRLIYFALYLYILALLVGFFVNEVPPTV